MLISIIDFTEKFDWLRFSITPHFILTSHAPNPYLDLNLRSLVSPIKLDYLQYQHVYQNLYTK